MTRPHVEISRIEKAGVIPPIQPFGTVFKYSIYLKNAGLTVAKNLRFQIQNVDAAGAFNDNDLAIHMYQDQVLHEKNSKKRIAPPASPAPASIAAGETLPVPLYSGGQEPMQRDGSMRYTFLIGRIDYADFSNGQHWTRFCYMVANANGDLGHCRFGNDDDEAPRLANDFSPDNH